MLGVQATPSLRRPDSVALRKRAQAAAAKAIREALTHIEAPRAIVRVCACV